MRWYIKLLRTVTGRRRNPMLIKDVPNRKNEEGVGEGQQHTRPFVEQDPRPARSRRRSHAAHSFPSHASDPETRKEIARSPGSSSTSSSSYSGEGSFGRTCSAERRESAHPMAPGQQFERLGKLRRHVSWSLASANAREDEAEDGGSAEHAAGAWSSAAVLASSAHTRGAATCVPGIEDDLCKELGMMQLRDCPEAIAPRSTACNSEASFRKGERKWRENDAFDEPSSSFSSSLASLLSENSIQLEEEEEYDSRLRAACPPSSVRMHAASSRRRIHSRSADLCLPRTNPRVELLSNSLDSHMKRTSPISTAKLKGIFSSLPALPALPSPRLGAAGMVDKAKAWIHEKKLLPKTRRRSVPGSRGRPSDREILEESVWASERQSTLDDRGYVSSGTVVMF